MTNVSKVHIRDVAASVKAALQEEYESYVRAGRDHAAMAVAKILREQYGDDPGKPDPEPPVERAVPDGETETPEKEQPARRGPGRPRKNPDEK